MWFYKQSGKKKTLPAAGKMLEKSIFSLIFILKQNTNIVPRMVINEAPEMQIDCKYFETTQRLLSIKLEQIYVILCDLLQKTD
jgi:hypothetical protein